MRLTTLRCLPVCLLICSMALQSAADEPAEKLVNANFTHGVDELGFRWDINSSSSVSDGTNDCFDNGLVLQVDGEQFSGRQRMQTADGSEYVLSQDMRNLTVTRRIRLDRQRGVVRYLEIFENEGASAVSVIITLQTTVGNQARGAYFSSGSPATGKLGKRDVGIGISAQSSRPDVLLLIGQAGAAVEPSVVVQQNRQFRVTYPLNVAPGARAIILHMVAQRPTGTVHPGGLAKTFRPMYRGRPIDPAIPAGMKDDIVNFGRGREEEESGNLLAAVDAAAEALNIKRGNAAILGFDADNHLTGQVEGGPIVIDTVYGKATLSLEDIALIKGAAGGGTRTALMLRSGEILTGEASGSLRLTNPEGMALDLTPADIHVLVLPVSSSDRVISTAVIGLIETKGGDRLALAGPQPGALEVATAWGPATLPLSQVQRLQPVFEPVPGYVVVLDDDSILAALPYGSPISVRTARFGLQAISPTDLRGYHAMQQGRIPIDVMVDALTDDLLAQAQFAMEDQDARWIPPFCVLKGGNRLAAELVERPLSVVTPAGVIVVDPAEVRLIQRDPDAASDDLVEQRWPTFTLTLAGGGKMTGRLADRMLEFVQGERRWEVPAAHVLAAWHPASDAPAVETTPAEGAAEGDEAPAVAPAEDTDNASDASPEAAAGAAAIRAASPPAP